ncbi:hypothetical protein PFISCL1PPCAC_4109, partial [Pristionchus fissidentatus]
LLTIGELPATNTPSYYSINRPPPTYGLTRYTPGAAGTSYGPYSLTTPTNIRQFGGRLFYFSSMELKVLSMADGSVAKLSDMKLRILWMGGGSHREHLDQRSHVHPCS